MDSNLILCFSCETFFSKKIIFIMFSHKNSQSNLILEHDVVIFRFGFSLSSQFLFLASFYKSWLSITDDHPDVLTYLLHFLSSEKVLYLHSLFLRFYIYILSFFGFKFKIIFQICLSQRDKFQTYSEILILSVITVLVVILYDLPLMLNERRIYYSWN